MGGITAADGNFVPLLYACIIEQDMEFLNFPGDIVEL
jgi:hypothetical protein